MMFYFLIQIFTLFLSLVFIAWMVFAISSIIKGAPFIHSRKKAIDDMVDLARIKPGEKSIDIGAGSGRVVFAFAQAGAEAHGLEINGFLVLWAKIRIIMLGLSGKAFAHWGNLWKTDLSHYDVVSVYGIVQIMPDLEKKLVKELKPGSRIVSNTFTFPTLQVQKERDGVYLYII